MDLVKCSELCTLPEIQPLAITTEGNVWVRLGWLHRLNTKDHQGYTPLIQLMEGYIERVDLARLLLDSGADINLCNRFGYTALILAVRKDRKESVKLLLKCAPPACLTIHTYQCSMLD